MKALGFKIHIWLGPWITEFTTSQIKMNQSECNPGEQLESVKLRFWMTIQLMFVWKQVLSRNCDAVTQWQKDVIYILLVLRVCSSSVSNGVPNAIFPLRNTTKLLLQRNYHQITFPPKIKTFCFTKSIRIFDRAVRKGKKLRLRSEVLKSLSC